MTTINIVIKIFCIFVRISDGTRSEIVFVLKFKCVVSLVASAKTKSAAAAQCVDER